MVLASKLFPRQAISLQRFVQTHAEDSAGTSVVLEGVAGPLLHQLTSFRDEMIRDHDHRPRACPDESRQVERVCQSEQFSKTRYTPSGTHSLLGVVI